MNIIWRKIQIAYDVAFGEWVCTHKTETLQQAALVTWALVQTGGLLSVIHTSGSPAAVYWDNILVALEIYKTTF